MSLKQFSHFLLALANTDGHQAEGCNIVWRTKNKSDVDLVTELCLKHNYDINVRYLKNASGYVSGGAQYNVSIGKNKRLDHKIIINEIPYNDYTYCLTMQNGTLITRYNLLPCITGNCYDRIYSDEFDIVEFHGGQVQKIRDNVLHLMRGEVYDLCGKSFFTFGGARSHDIQDGILDPCDYKDGEEFARVYKQWSKAGKTFRVNHFSWWEQELPSQQEMDRGREVLESHDWKVDYVLTHCFPQSVASIAGFRDPDQLTQYFDGLLSNKLMFKDWFCGHYHKEWDFGRFHIRYYKIERIV